MSPARKDPTPRAHGDEQSAIRDTRARPRRVSSPEIGTPRELRMEGKLERAETLLAALPAHDPRTRLLQVAMLRQDEALLDGILSSLEKPNP